MTSDKERYTILDISSDLNIFGLILAFILNMVNGHFGKKEVFILLGFLSMATFWKIVSPFPDPDNKVSSYVYAALLVIGLIGINIISTILK